MANSLGEALDRWGAFLLQPRATLASLAPDAGRHDGWWLGMLYVLGSQLVPLGQALKSASVMMNGSAMLSLASQFGRILLPPMLLILAVEFMLGNARAYRSSLFLLPLVLCGAAANLARHAGVGVIADSTPIFVAGAWALFLAMSSRSAIAPISGESESEASS